MHVNVVGYGYCFEIHYGQLLSEIYSRPISIFLEICVRAQPRYYMIDRGTQWDSTKIDICNQHELFGH